MDLLNLPGRRLYDHDVLFESFNIDDLTKLTTITTSYPANSQSKYILELIGSKLNIDIKELYKGDFSMVLWMLLVNTFKDHKHIRQWTCPKCKSTNQFEINPSNLIITPLRDDYEPKGLLVELSDRYNISIRLPKVYDELNAIDYFNTIGRKPTTGELQNCQLALCMDSDKNLDTHTLYTTYFVNPETKLTTDEYWNLLSFFNAYKYGVEDYVYCKCSACNTQGKLPLEVKLTDFFPSVFSSRFIYSRIRSEKVSLDQRPKEFTMDPTQVDA